MKTKQDFRASLDLDASTSLKFHASTSLESEGWIFVEWDLDSLSSAVSLGAA